MGEKVNMSYKNYDYVFTTAGCKLLPMASQQNISTQFPRFQSNHLKLKHSVAMRKYQSKEIETNHMQYTKYPLNSKSGANAKNSDEPTDTNANTSDHLVSTIGKTNGSITCRKKLLNRRSKSLGDEYHLNGSKRLPEFVHNSPMLTHDDLTGGQKQYIAGLARCYSVQGFMDLAQQRIRGVLDYEFMKRYITKDVPKQVKLNLWKEYCDYRKQIDQKVNSKSGLLRYSQSGQLIATSKSSVAASQSEILLPLAAISNVEDKSLWKTRIAVVDQSKNGASMRKSRPKSAKHRARSSGEINSRMLYPSPAENIYNTELKFDPLRENPNVEVHQEV